MAGSGNKSVRLFVLGDNSDAKLKIDAIDAKADELADKHPELKIGIDQAAASEKLKIFKDELSQAAEESDSYAAALDRVTLANDRMADAQNKQFDALEHLNSLQKSGTATTEEYSDALRVSTQASLDAAAARKSLADAEAEVSTMTKEASDEQVAAGLKTKAATEENELFAKSWEVTKLALLGVGGAIGLGIYKAAGFNQIMERIHTQAGLSQQSLAGLGSGVLKLAGQVGEDPDSLAEALYHVASNLGSLGATGPQMLGAVKIAAEGARVGGADLVDVTNALGAAIASGIPGVQNYQSAMGALNATVGAGDMTMQDLAEAMGTGFLSNVKIYGSTLNDVGSILATFGDNNIRGAHAATQLRMSVQSLAVQASTATPYLKELGLKAGELGKFQSAHGTVATINLLVQKLHEAGIASDDYGNIITQLFGKKAGAGIAVLIDQYERLNSKTKVLADGAKQFGSDWNATNQTLSQQWAELKDGSDALVTSLGQKFLPMGLSVIHLLTGFVNGLENGSAAATTVAAVVGTVLAGIALKKLEDGLSGAVEGFENLWKAGSKVVSFAGQMAVKLGLMAGAQDAETVSTEAATEAQTGLNLAFLASPITWIVAGLVLIGVGIYELTKHSKAFRDFWIDAWHMMTGAFDTSRHAIAVGFDDVRHNIADFAHNMASYFDEVRGNIHAWYSDTVNTVTKVVSVFVSLPGRLIRLFNGAETWLIDAGVRIIEGLIQGVENEAGRLWSYISGIGSKVSSVFKSALSIFSPSRVFMEHGRNIVLGLVAGIDGYANLAELSVRSLAQRSINASGGRFFGGVAANGSALQLEWVGGAGADAEFMTWLKKNIRIRGGNPAVLGR